MAALPLASPPGLVRLVPFEPGFARSEGASEAIAARARQGPERVPGPLVVRNPGASDAPVTLRAMGGDEVGPPHSQLPALQGGEVLLPGARQSSATPTGRTRAIYVHFRCIFG